MPVSKYIMESAPDAITRINGEDYLYFGGTSYYSLHKHPSVLNAAGNALKDYGILSATSRLGYGTTELLETLEKRASDFFGTEDAAYLASGFLSSMAGVQALEIQEGFDLVFLDELAHYSNRNAALSVEKPVYTFGYRDFDDLMFKLQKHVKPGGRPLIISDGVFPVFGEIAPVNKYLEL
ncbi:MAG: aminotransferase class I/II-fold pyridoxal phosphate-dependent enzyme, partial [Bacteroidota bacterium]|nr:aminotransferase class I/II-fold pyridoxal phosphate-dependent enzyme [Bacteroidota bacterium]